MEKVAVLEMFHDAIYISRKENSDYNSLLLLAGKCGLKISNRLGGVILEGSALYGFMYEVLVRGFKLDIV